MSRPIITRVAVRTDIYAVPRPASFVPLDESTPSAVKPERRRWVRCIAEVRGSVCGRHPEDPVHKGQRDDQPDVNHEYDPEQQPPEESA